MTNLKNFFKKHTFVLTVFAGWITTVYILYFIKYKMYAGAIDVLLLSVVIFPPLIALTDLLSEPAENKEKNKNKLQIIFNLIGIVTAICFVVWALLKSPYRVGIYDILAIALLMVILSWFPKFGKKLKNKSNQKERSVFVISIYAILIVVPIIFNAVTRTTTVKRAETILKNNGYTDIIYAGLIDNKRALSIVFKDKITLKDNKRDDLGFYLFKASKYNKEYGAAINILGGEISGETLIENNPYIHYYIR
jgi:hypothetical protein